MKVSVLLCVNCCLIIIIISIRAVFLIMILCCANQRKCGLFHRDAKRRAVVTLLGQLLLRSVANEQQPNQDLKEYITGTTNSRIHRI